MPELLAVFQDEVPGRCGWDIVETCGNQCMKHLVREFQVQVETNTSLEHTKDCIGHLRFNLQTKCDAVNGSSIERRHESPKMSTSASG